MRVDPPLAGHSVGSGEGGAGNQDGNWVKDLTVIRVNCGALVRLEKRGWRFKARLILKLHD